MVLPQDDPAQRLLTEAKADAVMAARLRDEMSEARAALRDGPLSIAAQNWFNEAIRDGGNLATGAAHGLMAAGDKAKLDKLVVPSYTFEDGTAGGVTGQSGTVTVATPEARSGLYSAVLTSTTTTADSTMIFLPFTVQEGRTYRLTAYVKIGTGSGQSIRIGGAYVAPDGSSTFISTLGGTPLSSTAYTQVSRDVAIPSRGAGLPGYKTFIPRLTSQNARVVDYSFYVDDVTFTDITEVVTLDAARKTYVDNRTALSVKDYGAVGDGVINDGVAIQNAVTAAVAQGRGLHWPSGTYLKTVNITNFHAVRHTGPGVVKHGSDLFYVQPRGTQANKLYVATTGVDTNDGLSAATPVLKVGKAVTTLDNYGPVLEGFWTVQLAAGTYTDRVIFTPGLDSVNTITVQGPIVNHPNVPTAIMSEGYNIGALAFRLFGVKASVTFSNIHMSGYNGTTSSCGISTAEVLNETFLVNCHFTDCYWGASVQTGMIDVKGGIFTRCGFLGDTANNVAPASRNGNGGGYRGLMYARHSIGTQNSGDLLKGPFFLGCQSGVYAQESCTGHVDWARVEDCGIGVNLGISSRANVDGTAFKRNGTDLRGIGNCNFYLSANNTFGTGADESAVKMILGSGSQVVDDFRVFTNDSQAYNSVMKITDTKFPAQSISTTSATIFYTLGLAPYFWRDALTPSNIPKRVRVKVYGSFTGTAGTKVINARLGSAIAGATYAAADVGTFTFDLTMFITGQGTQILTSESFRHTGGSPKLGFAEGSNALTEATNLTIEAVVGVATDVIKIDAIDMSWG